MPNNEKLITVFSRTAKGWKEKCSNCFNRWAKAYHEKSRDAKEKVMYTLHLGSNFSLAASGVIALSQAGMPLQEMFNILQVMKDETGQLVWGAMSTGVLGLGRSAGQLGYILYRNKKADFLNITEKQKQRFKSQVVLNGLSALTSIPQFWERYSLYLKEMVKEDFSSASTPLISAIKVCAPFFSYGGYLSRVGYYYGFLENLKKFSRGYSGEIEHYKPNFFFQKLPKYFMSARAFPLMFVASEITSRVGPEAGAALWSAVFFQLLAALVLSHVDEQIVIAIEKGTEPSKHEMG